MNTMYKRWRKSIITKTVQAGLAVTLVLGGVPAGIGQAAAPAASAANCEATGQGAQKVFLPLITRSGSNNIVAAQNNPVAQQTIPRQLRYAVGKTYVYDWNLTINSKTVTHDSGGTHDKGTTTTIVRALADVTFTDKGTDNVYSGQVTLRNPFVCNTDGTNESILNDPDMVKALETPLLFKQTANGVITSVAVPPNSSAQATNLQKGVLNALQMTLQEGANSYIVEEQGNQGTYKATYTLEEKDNHLQVSKSFGKADFTKLIMAGDEAKTLTMQSNTTAILDGAQGAPTSVETKEEITNGSDTEPANTPEGNYDGATIWSKVTSASKFNLKEVKATAVQAAALPLATYVEGDLGATLAQQSTNRRGIDLAQVNLDDEFATLEGDPDNPEHFARILDLVAADSGVVVLDKLTARLQANSGNDAVAKLYIDILAAVGTPYAQAIMSSVLGNPSVKAANLSATPSITVQEQAMIDTALIASPTITTVNTVKNVSQDVHSPLQETAVSVLGATIGKLADKDATTAQSLANELVQSLSTMTETADVELYLDAIGNAGLPSTLNAITTYISGTVQAANVQDNIAPDSGIKAAALLALRKIPGPQAEALLITTLKNAKEDEAIRLQAANALSARTDLSTAATSALQGYLSANLASPGLYKRTWYGKLGGEKLGVEFPGGMTVASPPNYYLYLYAYQRANGIIWGNHFNVVTGELLAKGHSQGVLFGAYLSLAGNRIRKAWELNVACNGSRAGMLWQGQTTFVNQRITVLIGPVPVTFSARLEGHAELRYNLKANICNGNNASASASIIPTAWARAIGEAGIDIFIAGGGLGVSADLLKTNLPLTVSASYNGSNFRFCGDIKVSTQPLSGRFYGWGKALFVFRKEWTIWSFSTPWLNYTLWSSCS